MSASQKNGTSVGTKFVAGSIAGATSKLLFSPLERMKLVSQLGEANGVFDSFRVIHRERGWRGFWKGSLPMVVRIVPSKGVLFACSDTYRDLLASLYFSGKSAENRYSRQRNLILPAWMHSVAGALAGTTSVVVTFPLDTLRTRIAGSLDGNQLGMVRTARKMLAEEGIRAFYRGCSKISFFVLGRFCSFCFVGSGQVHQQQWGLCHMKVNLKLASENVVFLRLRF